MIVPRSHHKYQELQELVASQRTNQFSDKDFYQTVYAARPDVFDDNVITAHVEAGDVSKPLIPLVTHDQSTTIS
eukprot:SAG31_NODE_2206_length_6194_cov_3.730763_3_plen_74_part_00